MPTAPQTLVLTGVSGAGKSTVGRALADRIGAVLLDADDFHPEANRTKMSAGVALADESRRAELVAAGRVRADQFAMDHLADLYLERYERISRPSRP